MTVSGARKTRASSPLTVVSLGMSMFLTGAAHPWSLTRIPFVLFVAKHSASSTRSTSAFLIFSRPGTAQNGRTRVSERPHLPPRERRGSAWVCSRTRSNEGPRRRYGSARGTAKNDSYLCVVNRGEGRLSAVTTARVVLPHPGLLPNPGAGECALRGAATARPDPGGGVKDPERAAARADSRQRAGRRRLALS